MYEFLVQNQVRLDFMIDPNTGAGGYSAASKKITFNSASTLDSESVLIEELFHAYQDHFYPNGISQYSRTTSGFSNIEFEAKFFQDLINFNFIFSGGTCCVMFPSSSTISSDDLILYQLWLDDITNSGTIFPEFDTISTAYFQWMQVFANTNVQYNFPINSTLLPEGAFSILNSNCN